MKKIQLFLLVAFTVLGGTLWAQSSDADFICGTYRVESPIGDDVVKIEIYRAKNGKYQGRFVWANHPNNPDGTPRTDVKNPDPSKRNRTIEQVVAVWNLTYKNGEWVDGFIYDANTGKTYGLQGKRSKKGNNMEMRYYWKRPSLGLNGTWIREK